MQNKVLVLGVDGLDPRLTKKYMNKGVMPNFTKFQQRGSAREDLVMLGAMPTITPADVDYFGYRCLCRHSWHHRFLESASDRIGYLGLFL